LQSDFRNHFEKNRGQHEPGPERDQISEQALICRACFGDQESADNISRGCQQTEAD
jgi:hypothetical protein